ncbi:hypothetical protein ACIRPN_31480 [Streptomyces sp. NPDC101230]|uniref:MFS transporter small subunit n=1 Tax=unclassified Streptomyces TaxID=2593676 RepID=UPI0038119801
MSDASSQSPPDVDDGTGGPRPPGVEDRRPLIVFTWLWVGTPLAYGLYELVRKATQLFTD